MASCVRITDVLNEVAVAVVGAVEDIGVFIVADGRKGHALHVDVGGLLERLAAGVVAAVDVGGEGVEVVGIVDFVVATRVVVRQAADFVLRPRRRRREQCND